MEKSRTPSVLESALSARLPQINRWAHRLAPALLMLFALIYYGMYYRSGLNLGGEGGTVAVIAQRLMEGKRPIADIFLGYNVLWFYPVVWLFQIFGPNYIALRIFFFVICTLTGLLGYRVVWRMTAQPLYALLAGALLIFVPGMIFRNYMGFFGLLNMLTLLEAYVLPHKTTPRRLLWIVAAAVALSLTFLLRVEVGFFMLAPHAGLIVLYPFCVRGEFSRRFILSIFAIFATIFAFLAMHLPIYLDAQKRGFAENFVGQYMEIPNMLRHHLKIYVGGDESRKSPSPNMAAPKTPAKAASAPNDPGTRPLPSIETLAKSNSVADTLLALSLYLPVFLTAIIVPVAGFGFLYALWKPSEEIRIQTLGVLTAMGCALVFFPQYYFFRPDLPHLCEFMSSFIPALALCIYYIALLFARRPPVLLRIALGAFLALAITDVAIYVYYADKKPSAGTSAAKHYRNVEFRAENGVRVLLQQGEAMEYKGIYDTIMAHSGPDDYVVCFPYSPTVNFMTNRKSYLYNLYVDNATTSAKKFYDQTVPDILQYRPAIILIDNRPINKTQNSRFSHWAAETYQFIRQNYQLVNTFGSNEIYVRPDKAQSPQS